MRASAGKFNASNKIKNIHFGKIIACIAIGVFMILMLVKPDFYLDSARRGLSLYATSVLPSLFPFYFFSLLLTYIGSAKSGFRHLLKSRCAHFYNAPKESAYILLLSMLSGYPVGASMTAELYSAGVITQKEAKSIAAFASTSGPIFMLGTVGSAIFNDVKIGAIILVAHYAASLINGLIFRVRKDKSDKTATNIVRDSKDAPLSHDIKSSPLKNDADKPVITLSAPYDIKALSAETDTDSIMSRTIANATLSMLYVGGYIVLCGMLVDTLVLVGLDNLILNMLGESAGQPVIAFIMGLIEMTRGSIACAACAPKNIGVALCAGIISLGGLSVTLQNYTFLSRCKMTFFDIILRKLSQSLIAFLIAFAMSFML